MAVRKRKSKLGETTEYHYEFMQSGKRYYGVCEGCSTLRAAELYEKNIRETVKKLAEQENVNALVENFKRELTGGNEITLEAAFSIYITKPAKRKRDQKQIDAKRSYWGDFVAFLHATDADVVRLDQVTRQHAEGYINHLKNNGRFIREIRNGNRTGYTALNQLSNATVNVYHKTMKSIFVKLKEDAGLLFNPFDFDMLENQSQNRDAFTPEELRLIGDNLNDFVRPIFIIGICTGLSEGDICLLRWREIRDGKWIMRARKKTRANLEIPILPPLARLLEEQYPFSGSGEFVLPEHAAMYKTNPSGISYRVKSFLEELGIETTRMVEGRGRATSVKDVHSLRHTFAYMAGCYQIPLPVVQSILGHMSPEMTKHYQAHADRTTKEKYLAQMPDFLHGTTPMIPQQSSLREELQRLISELPEERLPDVISACKALLPR